jgi:hypothetical protein
MAGSGKRKNIETEEPGKKSCSLVHKGQNYNFWFGLALGSYKMSDQKIIENTLLQMV